MSFGDETRPGKTWQLQGSGPDVRGTATAAGWDAIRVETPDGHRVAGDYSRPPAVTSARHVAELRAWLRHTWRAGGLFEHIYRVKGQTNHDIANERISLGDATLYYVEPTMVDLINQVRESAPLDVKPTDLTIPDATGFMYFATPIEGIDAENEGVTVRVDALMWEHTFVGPLKEHCLSMSSYTMWVTETEQGEKLTIWSPMGRSDWPFTEELGYRAEWAVRDLAWSSYLEDRQILTAIFTLLIEEGLTSRTVQGAPRSQRRQMARKGITAPPDVTVITLRQPRTSEPHPHEGSEGRTYSHRWTVREHLRWQPVGKGRQDRRLTLVKAHTRGPADAPLIVKDKVNRWVR